MLYMSVHRLIKYIYLLNVNFFNRNGFVCTEKGELLNKYVIHCTFMCVDVVRTAGVRLLDMRGLC